VTLEGAQALTTATGKVLPSGDGVCGTAAATAMHEATSVQDSAAPSNLLCAMQSSIA